MDERKRTIRELEEKKQADTEARNRLLEGLGETLFQRVVDGEFFPETDKIAAAADSPAPKISANGLAAEYRRLQKEINDSVDMIKSLEADTLRLKELEEQIFSREEEFSLLNKEFGECCTRLGSLLLGEEGFDEFADFYRQQEEALLSKINEQEHKIMELNEKEGGVFAWLGKNAQMVVAKALLVKNRSALQKVYNSAGEKFLSTGLEVTLSGETAESSGKAAGLRERLSSLTAALAGLKKERREMGDLFGSEGSPSRRIDGLENHIAHIKGELPGVCLRFGSLAADADGRKDLTSVIREEDGMILAQAEIIGSRITEGELEIQKIKTTINIDNEKAEIEKLQKAITGQQQKIAAANEAILDLEKQIEESERCIEEMNTFLEENK